MARDFAAHARHVVEQAIGEHLDGTPLENPNAGKEPLAMTRGRAGGKKGGKARAAILSPNQRKRIARKAAKTRWGSWNPSVRKTLAKKYLTGV